MSEPIRLVADKVLETTELLQRRVAERFPDAGLTRLCGQLERVAADSRERSAELSRPILWLRGLIAAMILLLLAGIFTALHAVGAPAEPLDLLDVVALAESSVNDLVFVALAIAFLMTLEARIKRRRALTPSPTCAPSPTSSTCTS